MINKVLRSRFYHVLLLICCMELLVLSPLFCFLLLQCLGLAVLKLHVVSLVVKRHNCLKHRTFTYLSRRMFDILALKGLSRSSSICVLPLFRGQ